MLFAYLGPDTVLPLTSVLAAIAGGVMMFGRGFVRVVRDAAARLTGRADQPPTAARRDDVLRRGLSAAQGRPVGRPHRNLNRQAAAREAEPSDAS
jgi:hypothetical protein